MKDISSKHQNGDTSSPNFMVLLFIIGYLLMDFLPSFKIIERVSPQYLYLTLLNIIVGVYCYCNPRMISQNLILVCKNSSILKIYGTFLFFCSVSIITANNVSLALVSFSKLLIVFCMFINLTMLLYNRLNLLFQIAFIVGISVFIQSSVILFDFSKTLDLSAIKGNTGNINILAASLSIKNPFLILGIIHFSAWKRRMLILALLLSTTIIFLTGSRATFLGVVLQLIVFLVFYIKINTIKKVNFIKVASVIIPIFISFVISNLIFTKVGGSDLRYKSVENRIEQIGLSDSSTQLRLDLWENATKIIAEKPLLGVGIGNWKIADLPYENTIVNNSDVSGHTHNDFLELTAETGILNGVIYFSLFVFVFFISIKKILRANEKEEQLVAVLSLMLLFGYGLDALFNFPLYIPAMQLGFCFLLVLTLVNETKISSTVPVAERISITRIATVSIISLVCLYFAFSQFRAAQLEFKFKVYQAVYRINNSLPQTGRLLESNDIIANLPKFPSVSYYSEPFLEYAGVSLFYEKKYDEALSYFIQAKKINPYLGNSDWYIHKIAFIKGDLDNASKYAKIAFYKRPRNKDFYLSALLIASKKNDTLEMLKIHNKFSVYRKMSENWVNTSKALQLSGFSNKKILSFLDQGLREFPKDSLLLERKSSLRNTLRDNYLLIAQQHGVALEFEKAIEYYKKALIENPSNAIVTQNIGVCYFKLNQYKRAIVYLSKIEDAPDLDDGKTQYILGACYISIKNKEKGCWYLNASKSRNFAGAKELMEKFCN